MADGCPVGELLAAVLGTFFGTLLFCFALAVLLVFIYRRQQQRLMAEQRIAGKFGSTTENIGHENDGRS